MPPLPRLRIAALDELARQLRFAPAQTLRRQLTRARKFAAEIDPERNYPEEWVVFRVTGYRPQEAQEGVIVGQALLGDISALVERLSAAAQLRPADLAPGQHLTAPELERRWRVSRKSLDRYRRQGLIALRVLGEDQRPRLVFPLDDIARFEARLKDRLRDAAAYSRLGPVLEARILRRAAAYQRLGCSLNQAAARIATRYGRAHETVRQLLKRHDAGAARPIFAEQGPPSARERRLIERGCFAMIEPGALSKRLGRTRASIHRVMLDQRAARLRTLNLAPPPVTCPPPSRSSSRDPSLRDPAVTQGLGFPGERELPALVAAARSTQPIPAADERTQAQAMRILLARAAEGIAALPRRGCAAAAVDRVETDLRWAARLKAVMVRGQLPLLIRTIESVLARPVEDLRAADLRTLVLEGLAALSQAVDDYHPQKGGRLAAPAGLALNRAITRLAKSPPFRELLRSAPGSSRNPPAAPRPRATAISQRQALPDWTLSLCPWQTYEGHAWLEPPARTRTSLDALDDHRRLLLTLRYGWGPHPHTLAELSPLVGTTSLRAAVMERSAVRAALALPRP
jgi:RNA polymerase primary sigma factor